MPGLVKPCMAALTMPLSGSIRAAGVSFAISEGFIGATMQIKSPSVQHPGFHLRYEQIISSWQLPWFLEPPTHREFASTEHPLMMALRQELVVRPFSSDWKTLPTALE